MTADIFASFRLLVSLYSFVLQLKRFFPQKYETLLCGLTCHRSSLPWQRKDCQQVQEIAGRTAVEGCTGPKINHQKSFKNFEEVFFLKKCTPLWSPRQSLESHLDRQ